MLKCGMSEINITPPLGLSIPGYFTGREATGIKDDLFAKALVADDGNVTAVIIAVDSLCVDRDVVEKIRKRASELTNIDPGNIMISATHTHTGTPVLSRFAGPEEEKYMDTYIKKVADAAVIAYNKREPVKIGFGLGHEEDISFNRRFYMKDTGKVMTNPGVGNPFIDKAEGSINPEVVVMRIDDIQGNPIGVLTNFACHPDVVGGNEYSADYPGQLSRTLKKLLGENVVSLFLNGACGNINHINVFGDEEKEKLKKGANGVFYLKMGKVLAGEVFKVREKIDYSENDKVDVKSITFTSDIRRPTSEEIEEAKKVLQSETTTKREKRFANLVVNFNYDMPETTEVEVQVVRIGDLAVVGLPGEIFVEFAFDIKSQSQIPYTIVSNLSNGNFGYIVTKEALKNGGYETLITSRPKVVVEAGYEMVIHAVNIIKNM